MTYLCVLKPSAQFLIRCSFVQLDNSCLVKLRIFEEDTPSCKRGKKERHTIHAAWAWHRRLLSDHFKRNSHWKMTFLSNDAVLIRLWGALACAVLIPWLQLIVVAHCLRGGLSGRQKALLSRAQCCRMTAQTKAMSSSRAAACSAWILLLQDGLAPFTACIQPAFASSPVWHCKSRRIKSQFALNVLLCHRNKRHHPF